MTVGIEQIDISGGAERQLYHILDETQEKDRPVDSRSAIGLARSIPI
jgi:hypothetical protein